MFLSRSSPAFDSWSLGSLFPGLLSLYYFLARYLLAVSWLAISWLANSGLGISGFLFPGSPSLGSLSLSSLSCSWLCPPELGKFLSFSPFDFVSHAYPVTETALGTQSIVTARVLRLSMSWGIYGWQYILIASIPKLINTFTF